jgi:hypothetical protein
LLVGRVISGLTPLPPGGREVRSDATVTAW